MEQNRAQWKAKYDNIDDFKNKFEVSDQLFQELMEYAHKEGVRDSVPFLFSKRAELFLKEKATELDSLYHSFDDLNTSTQFQEMFMQYMTDSYKESMRLRNFNKANELIKDWFKYEIAKILYSFGDAYQIYLMKDEGFLKALEVINNDKIFKKFNVDY
jgi:hypothetical protein